MATETSRLGREHGRLRQVAFAITASIVGAAAVLLLVGSASLRQPESEDTSVHFMLEQIAAPEKARFQELWFGPGITDDLNRMIKLGQLMSPKLSDYIKKGLKEQSKMVHLDAIHQGEAGSATAEADLWSSMGGNNNGGNDPCMKDPGQCP